MLEFITYREQPSRILAAIPSILDTLFDEHTLVLYDIRSVIIQSALPHIPYVATYDQRVISILNNATVVCSEPFPEALLEYYKSFGLCKNASVITVPHQSTMTLINQILLDEDLCTILKNKGFHRLVTFLPTPEAEILAARLAISLWNTYEISQKANDKVTLKEFLIERGLPTIPGVITDDPFVIEQYGHHKTKHFIKLGHGASGFGLYVTQDQPIEQIIAECAGKRVIIEPKISVVSSPAVQFYCDEESVYILSIADQIIEGGRYYLGNKYPSIYSNNHLGDEMLRQSKMVLEYIHTIGYRGFGCIDMMVTDTDDIYVAEVNARFVGHTPASLINFMLHNDINKPRSFISHDDQKYSIVDVLDNKNNNHFPISLGALDKWGKVQYLIWD